MNQVVFRRQHIYLKMIYEPLFRHDNSKNPLIDCLHLALENFTGKKQAKRIKHPDIQRSMSVSETSCSISKQKKIDWAPL